MAPATAAAMVLIKVSRCLTWAISWANTARTSAGLRSWSSPVVTHTAACFGERPVAKAFGACWGDAYTRGAGMPARALNSSTMRCSSGASAGDKGRAPMVASAILSEKKKATMFMTPPKAKPASSPRVPQMLPIAIASPMMAASRIVVFRLFTNLVIHTSRSPKPPGLGNLNDYKQLPFRFKQRPKGARVAPRRVAARAALPE